MTEMNELQRDTSHMHGSGWRTLDPPVVVRGYFANQWHDVTAVSINDDTRELRIELPQQRDEHGVDLISHKVLPADLYDAPAGTL